MNQIRETKLVKLSVASAINVVQLSHEQQRRNLMVEFVWQTFLPVTDQTLQASFFSKTVFRFNGKLFFYLI